MKALTILGLIILLVIVFYAGRKVQKQKDKPVYVPEGMEHDGSKPHIHEHDKKNITIYK